MRDFGLIRDISKGDMAALEALYRRYDTDVYKLAYMMTKSPQDSEDIMQDVFLSVVKNAGGCKYDLSVKGWILTITRNLCLNFIRRNALACRSEYGAAELGANDDAYEEIEFLDLIKDLHANEQEIIIYHLIYGLKHREIADILSKSHASVRKQYQRALKKLKNNLMAKRDDSDV